MNDGESNLLKLLDKIALEQNFENYTVDVKPISSDGANYSSALYTAIISETSKQEFNLFAKILTIGKELREDGGKIVSINEIEFYNNVLPLFKKLEEDYDVPNEYRLSVPKFYAADPTYMNEIVVMEDMTASGFTAFDRFCTADWNYASVAFEELAKWHALSIAFGKVYPEELEKVTENKEFEQATILKMNKMIESSTESAIDVIEEGNRDKVRNLLAKYRESNTSYCNDFYKPLRCPVLIHGDYRPSNLVHKINDDGTYSLTILDFQTFRLGNLASDLVYFIISSTDENFRKNNFHRLIDHYYTNLELSLKRLNIDINAVYSREDFDYELKEVLPFGLLWAAFVLPIVTVNPEDAPVFNKIEDISFPVNTLFIERINGLVNDFIKWNVL